MARRAAEQGLRAFRFVGVDRLSGEKLHRRVIGEGVLRAERSVWIATANLKDLR